MRLGREQVLAHRIAVQGLHRDTREAAALAVLDLGVQDSPAGSAAQALAVRLGEPPTLPTDALATTWTLRGAPHVHRAGELAELARALWPVSDDDALARLDTSASPVRAAGLPAREALRLVAGRIADIVEEPMPKGEVSAALTPRIPPEMTVDCRRCEATHVVETLFRTAVLPAGMRFDPGRRTVTFVPIEGWPGIPTAAGGTEAVVTAYLRLHGPATPREVAGFLGTRPAEVEGVWPDDLTEVEVDGRRAWIPEADAGALASPPQPPHVRLLPTSDPFLQARDRELVVPDPAHRKVLWPILGRPGAVVVDGEVAGAWRARKRSRRLEVTVQPFRRLPAARRARLEEEAHLLARARGAAEATVTLETSGG